jgi:WD40 repeat protein
MEKLQGIEHRVQTMEERIAALPQMHQLHAQLPSVEEDELRHSRLLQRFEELQQRLTILESSKVSPWKYVSLIPTTHSRGIWNILELSDGRVCSVGNEGSVQIWDIETVRCLKTLIPAPSGRYKSSNNIVAWVEYEDNKLATMHIDTTLNLWDTITGECLKTIAMPSCQNSCISLTPLLIKQSDGRLVSLTADRTIRVWNTNTGNCEKSVVWQQLVGGSYPINPTQLYYCSPHKILSYAYGMGSNVQIFDLKQWKAETGVPLETECAGYPLTFLKDGKIASTGGGSYQMLNNIKLWDIKKVRHNQMLTGHSERVSTGLQLADNVLATASDDKSIKIWDLQSGQCIQTLCRHAGPVGSLTRLKDGRLASATRNEGTIIIWDNK